MKKTALITVLLLAIATAILAGCNSNPSGPTGPLFNETLNQQLENLSVVAPGADFKEFYFNYTPRNDSKYELAEDDVFSLSMGNFTSTEISVFGVMLGDSLESVIDRLGVPDVSTIPYDESYRNLEYRKRIGIGGTEAGMTIHLVNDTVERITVKSPFKKYLQGNTSVGTDKEIIYFLLDIPDYQDFVNNRRVFYYVEKGVELYFDNRYVERISLVFPEEFKGVEYLNQTRALGTTEINNQTEEIMGNVTVPVRK